jgi:hypothetical protein
MAHRSPCEVARGAVRLRLLNSENEFIPDAPYKMTLGSGEVREGQADDTGWLVEQNVETPERITVEWGYPTEHGISPDDRAKRWAFPGPYGYSLDVILYTEDGTSDEEQALRHLNNLGYPSSRTLKEQLTYFQRDYEVFPGSGELTDDTKKALAMADNDGLSREEFIKKWADSQGGGGA